MTQPASLLDRRMFLGATAALVACRAGGPAKMAVTTDAWHIRGLGIEDLWQEGRGARAVVAVVDAEVARDVLDRPVQVHRIGAAPRTAHATSCASLIGSSLQSCPGIAPEVNLLSVVVDRQSPAQAAAAIDWCRLHKVDVVSCSFVLAQRDDALDTAVREASARGMVVVGPAGLPTDAGKFFPEQVVDATVVTAHDVHESRVPSARAKGRRDVSAPGDELPALRADGVVSRFGETSAAVAVFSGTVALLLDIARARSASIRAKQIASLLRQTAVAAQDPTLGARLIRPKDARSRL